MTKRKIGLGISAGGMLWVEEAAAIVAIHEHLFKAAKEAGEELDFHYVGTSAGSVVATLASLGVLDTKTMAKDIVLGLFKLQSRYLPHPLNPVNWGRFGYNAMRKAGLIDLQRSLMATLERFAQEANNPELFWDPSQPPTLGFIGAKHGREVSIFSCNAPTGREVCFNSRHHPSILMADAVTASAAVPGLFAPVEVTEDMAAAYNAEPFSYFDEWAQAPTVRLAKGDQLLDGGACSMFPLDYFITTHEDEAMAASWDTGISVGDVWGVQAAIGYRRRTSRIWGIKSVCHLINSAKAMADNTRYEAINDFQDAGGKLEQVITIFASVADSSNFWITSSQAEQMFERGYKRAQECLAQLNDNDD